MPVGAGVYCDLPDLRRGDIPLPSYMGDGSKFVDNAAEEIDAAIGHIYVTPVVLVDTPANRPTRLLLKKINWLVASGRLILELAASGEDHDLHTYGRRMLEEGLNLLQMIVDGNLVLVGAEPVAPADPEAPAFTGPAFFQEDSESLVQSFYDMLNPGIPIRFTPPEAYGATRE